MYKYFDAFKSNMKIVKDDTPVRQNVLAYGKQSIDADDIESVVKVLKGDYLTTGPYVKQFEDDVAKYVGKKYAVATSNGTTSLYCAIYAIDLKHGDEVIVPAISFVSTANCVEFMGGVPVFCDVEPDTLNIDPNKIEKLITVKTRAIIAVDFAGQLCNYAKIREIADKYNLKLIADAAHSIGAHGVGALCDLTSLSFHPVKIITTGEGGMVVTDNLDYYNRMMMFRSHGINNDYKSRYLHYYDMKDIGFNYRLTDIQAALGTSQLKKADKFVARRKEIVALYNKELQYLKDYIEPLTHKYDSTHHIYVVKLKNLNRDKFFERMKAENIGVNVHYRPIYLHSYYQNKYGDRTGLCPIAEQVYQQIITLPIYYSMTNDDVYSVLDAICKILM